MLLEEIFTTKCFVSENFKPTIFFSLTLSLDNSNNKNKNNKPPLIIHALIKFGTEANDRCVDTYFSLSPSPSFSFSLSLYNALYVHCERVSIRC